MIANKDPFIKKFNELDALCREKRDKIISVWKKRNSSKWNAMSEDERFKLGKGIRLMKTLMSLLPEKESEALHASIVVRNTIHDKRNLFVPTQECINFLDGIILELKNDNIGAIDFELAVLKKSNISQMKRMLDNIWQKVRPLQYEHQEPIKAKLNSYIVAEEGATEKEEAGYIFVQFKSYYNDIPYLPEVRKARQEVRDINLEKAKREMIRELDEEYSDAQEEILEELHGFKRSSALKRLKEKYLRYKSQIESCIDYDELDDIDVNLDCYDY